MPLSRRLPSDPMISIRVTRTVRRAQMAFIVNAAVCWAMITRGRVCLTSASNYSVSRIFKRNPPTFKAVKNRIPASAHVVAGYLFISVYNCMHVPDQSASSLKKCVDNYFWKPGLWIWMANKYGSWIAVVGELISWVINKTHGTTDSDSG